eukprot:UN17808
MDLGSSRNSCLCVNKQILTVQHTNQILYQEKLTF